jgi:predicted alpha/beta hydrolase
MDLLAKKGIKVFAVDFRGFGSTKRDSSGWLSPNRAVQDLNCVINWLEKSLRGKHPTILGEHQMLPILMSIYNV